MRGKDGLRVFDVESTDAAITQRTRASAAELDGELYR